MVYIAVLVREANYFFVWLWLAREYRNKYPEVIEKTRKINMTNLSQHSNLDQNSFRYDETLSWIYTNIGANINGTNSKTVEYDFSAW